MPRTRVEPSSRWHPRGGVPLVLAHRGASAHAPENSVAAFERAIDAHADGVELDVRLAACGTIVVAHDPTLDRVAGRAGVIAALDARALGQIELLGPEGTTVGIPTLDAAIDLVVGAGLSLHVELKGDVPDRRALVEQVARRLGARSPREREAIVVSSFRPEMLHAFRRRLGGVPIAFLFDEANTGVHRAGVLIRLLRPDGVHPHRALASRAAIAGWHRRGFFVNAWTVDDENRLELLASDGVDGVITNDPARARAFLGR